MIVRVAGSYEFQIDLKSTPATTMIRERRSRAKLLPIRSTSRRCARAAVLFVNPGRPACTEGDCDHDGILNEPADLDQDRDGNPAPTDKDDNNDEVPDGGKPDRKQPVQ